MTPRKSQRSSVLDFIGILFVIPQLVHFFLVGVVPLFFECPIVVLQNFNRYGPSGDTYANNPDCPHPADQGISDPPSLNGANFWLPNGGKQRLEVSLILLA